jgi:hypothetical protein
MGMYYLSWGVMMGFTEKGVVTFSMPAFVDEIVRNAEVAIIAETPAGNNLFYMEETSPKLSKEASETFTAILQNY